MELQIHPRAVYYRFARRIAKMIRSLVPERVLFPVYNAYAAAKIKRLLSRVENPFRLEHFGRQVYSQNEEDGIIAEIFRRIGTASRDFVEFGSGDGAENNTRLLLEQGWRGLWIEGSKSNVETAAHLLAEPIAAGRLKIINELITRENINRLITNGGYAGGKEVDLLVIDIDGNDAHVWQAIDVINPRVVCIEYNAHFGPTKPWTMEYDPHFQHIYDGRHLFGASLKLLENLGRKKNYRLVGCNLVGVNAFFVRDDLVDDHFVKGTAEEFFHPPRFRLKYAVKQAFGKQSFYELSIGLSLSDCSGLAQSLFKFGSRSTEHRDATN